MSVFTVSAIIQRQTKLVCRGLLYFATDTGRRMVIKAKNPPRIPVGKLNKNVNSWDTKSSKPLAISNDCNNF